MKIAVKVTVEMTPEQVESYADVNGVERTEVRDDVRRYILSALQDSPAFTGGQADVAVAL
jgi:hypothetical protein